VPLLAGKKGVVPMRMLREHLPQRHVKKLAYVWMGLKDSWTTSSGFRLHLVADFTAFVLGGVFTVSLIEWVWLVLIFILKNAMEPFNSAIELLVDEVYQGNHHIQAKRMKDFTAFGVFVTIIGSFIIWGVVFIPRFYDLVI